MVQKEIATKKDKLFDTTTILEDFEFNERVVEVFDDMLDRSIPFYTEVIGAVSSLLEKLLSPGDRVTDLGCATGTSLTEISRKLSHKDLLFTGVDNSTAMLEKARLKAELYSKTDRMSFVAGDITTYQEPGTSCFILNYTLQFIRPLQRAEFLKHLFDNLRSGGVIILSEKTICHDVKLNRQYIDIYHNYKKKRGYSELEIAKKREALENVLIPFSIDENKKLLEATGFTSIETFFQWFNFSSFIAIKP